MVGCLACCEVLCLTLVGRVHSFRCRGDASLGAGLLGMKSRAVSLLCCCGSWLGSGGGASLGGRLLGMRSSALANVHSLQCRGDTSCGVRMLGMHACVMSLLCRYGAWLGSGDDASLGARLLGMRSSALAYVHNVCGMYCRGDGCFGAGLIGMW